VGLTTALVCAFVRDVLLKSLIFFEMFFPKAKIRIRRVVKSALYIQ
jgi:hypothetical protein